MSNFVESLRRLFLAQRLTLAQIKNLLVDKKITPEDYSYIINGESR